jgi:hypothetical protein
MSNVINFTAVLNARRAGAEAAKFEAAKVARIEAERKDIANSLGGTAGAHIIADVVMDLKAKDRALRPMPAYCDPANEFRGSKYEATKGLRLADIAARMRADIKALGLAKGVKVSVRTRTYTGGGAIDIYVTALPESFKVMSDKAASWRKQFGERADYPFYWQEAQSEELQGLLAKLKGVHTSYNRDNSDSMTDYFDTRYYGSAEIEWQVRRDREAAEIAANPGTYWADDCVRH